MITTLEIVRKKKAKEKIKNAHMEDTREARQVTRTKVRTRYVV